MPAEQSVHKAKTSLPKIQLIDYPSAYTDGQHFSEPGKEWVIFNSPRNLGVRGEENPEDLQHTPEFS
jgi:hypothetical protein